MKCKLCEQNPEYKWGLCYGCSVPKDNPKRDMANELAPLIKRYNQSVDRLVEITKKFKNI